MSVRKNLRRDKYWQVKNPPIWHGESLIDDFIRDAARWRVLSHDEELELGDIIWENSTRTVTQNRETIVELFGDGIAARDRVIQANMRLVVHLSKKYIGTGYDQIDIISDGVMGLHRAAEMFDPTKGFKFSTYSYYWIRQAMARGLADRGRVVRLPCHITEKKSKIWGEIRRQSALKGRTVRPEEVAAAVKMPVEKVREIAEYYLMPASLDQQTGEEITLGSTIAAPDLVKDIEAKILEEQLWQQLVEIMPLECAELLWLRYVEGLTRKELQARLNVSLFKLRSLLDRSVNYVKMNRDRFVSFLDLEVG